MKRTIRQTLSRFAKEPVFGQPCPEILWDDIVRIEAVGTDAFGPFQLWITFTYDDDTQVRITSEMKGYWNIVDSLTEHFPLISPDWYNRMAETPWDAEAVLFEHAPTSSRRAK